MMERETPGFILVVGPENELLQRVTSELKAAGLPVRRTAGVDSSLGELDERDIWALVTTDQLEDGSGVELAQTAFARDTDLVPVVIFDDESMSGILEAVRAGVNLRLFPRENPASELVNQMAHRYRSRAGQEARRGDRRQFPRVQPAGMVLVGPPGASLVDVAPGGVALRTTQQMAVGDRFHVAISVRHPLPPIEVPAEVVRAEQDDLGRWFIAARFPSIPGRERDLILAAVREHLTSLGPREMQRRFEETSAADITPIVTGHRIRWFLQRACDQQLTFRVGAVTGGTSWMSDVLGVDAQEGWFEAEPPPASAMVAPGQLLDFLLHHEFEGYLFEARITQASPDRIRCSLPPVIYYSEKRRRLRHSFCDTVTLRVEFESPLGDGTLSFPVLDVSSQGASFEVDAEAQYFYPGTPIESLRITYDGQVVLRERVEVRHITHLGDGERAKVGIRFAPRRDADEVVARSGRLPAVTAAAPTAEPTESMRADVLKFLNSDGEEITALCNRSYRGDGRFEGPVVVMPPAWGYTKESLSAYALTLLLSFERCSRPVVVLRPDLSHHRGESHVPSENRVPGRESVDFTLSRVLQDVQATVRFAFANPLFRPTSLTLFGCSFSAPVALRAARLDPRIDHVVCLMGTPSTQHMAAAASGGLDYVGGVAMGMRFGLVDFLGSLIDMDGAAEDAIAAQLAYLEDTSADVEQLQTAITWLVGRDDGWVDPQRIRELLKLHPGDHELIMVDAGHLPTHAGALPVAAEASRAVFARLGLDLEDVAVPSAALLAMVQEEEWDRAPKAEVQVDAYWREYLLGGGEDSLGFDVLGMTDAYRDFARTQAEMLDIQPSHRVLDAGAGTGHFWSQLLQRQDAVHPAAIELIDLVDAALERAQAKLKAADAPFAVTARVLDLQVNPLVPVRRYLDGEYHGIRCLRGRIAGLDDRTADQLVELYRGPMAPLVHEVVRGEVDNPPELSSLSPELRWVLGDLGRAARLVRGTVRESDLLPEMAAQGRLLLSAGRAAGLDAGFVRFDRLQFGRSGQPEPLLLESGRFDRVLASLLLPYVLNPDETLRELCRSLKPGGTLVASTMKPDTDISKIHRELVEQVSHGLVPLPDGWTREALLDELRAYTSAAAFLLRLTEEGTFHFYTADQLGELMRSVGLVDVEVTECFGDPAQAYVGSGRLPPDRS